MSLLNGPLKGVAKFTAHGPEPTDATTASYGIIQLNP